MEETLYLALKPAVAFILDFTEFYDTGGKDPPEKASVPIEIL